MVHVKEEDLNFLLSCTAEDGFLFPSFHKAELEAKKANIFNRYN